MVASRAQESQLLSWVRIPGGRFLMGSFDFYAEEAPQHERSVEPFEMAATPTTNDEFAAFVADTGYVTVAERPLSESDFPHLGAARRAPGSLVFAPTDGPVDLRDWQQWWTWTPGAQWRHPLGPLSDLVGRGSHPVVQVAYADARAYAEWAGARLPTEAEHEFAAAGGAVPGPYVWGRDRDPAGVVMANTWHGRFPYLNAGANGWVGTSPVDSFPANGYGLFDAIGNVWEWTSDLFTPSHAGRGGEEVAHGAGTLSRVIKGGSHLCAPEYCLKYRPAARSPQQEDSATSHIGFRCVRPAR
ncbi:Formylglycine-generating enzyme [Leucobacter sp. BZR 635]